MKHTCSYLQWKLSIDWNPVSIKYQIHKKIIKICTTLHLNKKMIEWSWVYSELTLNLGSKFTHEKNLFDIVHE